MSQQRLRALALFRALLRAVRGARPRRPQPTTPPPKAPRSSPALRRGPSPLTAAAAVQGGRLPAANRRAFVRRKVRDEFRAARGEADPARAAALLAVGEVQLDNLRAQAEHHATLEAKGIRT